MNSVSRFTSLHFDPIKFLGLRDLEEVKKKELRPKLLKNISQYILIRLLDFLPDKVDKEVDSGKITTVEELMGVFKRYLPDLEKKIDLILNDFKREYYQCYGRKN